MQARLKGWWKQHRPIRQRLDAHACNLASLTLDELRIDARMYELSRRRSMTSSSLLASQHVRALATYGVACRYPCSSSCSLCR